MTKKETLLASTRLATQQGWSPSPDKAQFMRLLARDINNPSPLRKDLYYDIIFDLDFLKNLFGTVTITHYPFEEDGDMKVWEEKEAYVHHAQIMVLQDEPLDYLREYLKSLEKKDDENQEPTTSENPEPEA